jgi:YegS/Rv2252/BmrU family lipid kinase
MSAETVVIVNPASANGRTGRRWTELATSFRSHLDEFEVRFTEAPRHGAELARQAVEAGVKHIISVGGDGTHNEVVNGLFRDGEIIDPEVVLSIVPTGTGGDLRRTLGLPLAATDAIAHVGKRVRPVDVGRVTYVNHDGQEATDYFINIGSFGISGLVDKLVNESSKALGGKLSFYLGLLRATVQYRNQALSLVLDPDTDHEQRFQSSYYSCVVANARYFGGGMMVAPDAQMSDGLFDIILMGDLGKIEALSRSGQIYAGTHLKNDKMDLYRGKVLVAEPMGDAEVLIDLDGEQPGRLPARFELIPNAVRLAMGPENEQRQEETLA